MIITEIEQETLDIEWFFINDDNVGCVLSGAGKLPESVDKSEENNEQLYLYFKMLPERSGIIINPSFNKIIDIRRNKEYVTHFVKMAKKGLFSFDKTTMNNFLDPHYHLVAKPIDPLRLVELPSEILELLMETKYNGELGTTLDISTIE